MDGGVGGWSVFLPSCWRLHFWRRERVGTWGEVFVLFFLCLIF